MALFTTDFAVGTRMDRSSEHRSDAAGSDADTGVAEVGGETTKRAGAERQRYASDVASRVVDAVAIRANVPAKPDAGGIIAPTIRTAATQRVTAIS